MDTSFSSDELTEDSELSNPFFEEEGPKEEGGLSVIGEEERHHRDLS